MDLCTLTRVKSRLDIDSEEAEYDSLLTDLVRAASDEIEKYLDRTILTGAQTEYFDVIDKSTSYPLKAYPISSITSVWNDVDWAFGSGTLIGSDYYRADEVAGELHINPNVLLSGFGALKVSYTGGMATTTDNFMSSYLALSDACVRHACFLFNARRHIGAANVTSHSGNVSFSSHEQFMPDVKAILDRHRRRRLL